MVSINEPSINSIPPPALLARFSVIVTPSSTTSPFVLKRPPPEPAAPSAMFRVITVPLATLSVPPLLKIPPPPLSAAAPEAIF